MGKPKALLLIPAARYVKMNFSEIGSDFGENHIRAIRAAMLLLSDMADFYEFWMKVISEATF
jgi:hypothetical protein